MCREERGGRGVLGRSRLAGVLQRLGHTNRSRKRNHRGQRKRLQVENASKKSPGAKQIKVADKTCNLRSILDDPPEGWPRPRQLEYFEWASKVYEGLKGANPTLDAAIERVLAAGIEKLSTCDD